MRAAVAGVGDQLLKPMTRRSFLLTATAAAAASAASAPSRKKIALIATVMWKNSHAQHFVDRLALGYAWDGQWRSPQVDLVALYIDQFPAGVLLTAQQILGAVKNQA